jgi:acyl-CoA reductase-like NAD-dependent aldehyde dehydrogenase
MSNLRNTQQNQPAQKKCWAQSAAAIKFETRPFIGDDYVPSGVGCSATDRNVFTTVNPATENVLADFADAGGRDVDQAVMAARKSFVAWRHYAPDYRKAVMFAVADHIERERDTLALLDSLEMGMPISMALDQVDGAAGFLRYNAELIDKVYGEIAPSDAATSIAFSQPEPRGVVGIICPWNFPLVTIMLAIAPALAAGNSVVVKPSEQTPSSALKLAEIAAEAGLPAGVLNVVPGLGITAGAALASHNDVDKLHFTGSTQVGRQLMVYAGQSNGKPMMLELGGKSPQIVFEDAADLPRLGATLAQSAFYNSGQLCVAKTRLLVHENIKEKIVEAIQAETKDVFTMGDPLDENTTFGPIASNKQLDRIKTYLELGKKEGAAPQILMTAGEMPKTGNYIRPTLSNNTQNTFRIAQEEIFGPVLSVISFKTDEEAIQLANAVDYGLAATAWTKDLSRARRLARDLNAGDISICATTSPATPSAALSVEPFGASGYGVLGGRRGLEAYQRIKGIQIITD